MNSRPAGGQVHHPLGRAAGRSAVLCAGGMATSPSPF